MKAKEKKMIVFILSFYYIIRFKFQIEFKDFRLVRTKIGESPRFRVSI
jgi:hypothetical protein